MNLYATLIVSGLAVGILGLIASWFALGQIRRSHGLLEASGMNGAGHFYTSFRLAMEAIRFIGQLLLAAHAVSVVARLQSIPPPDLGAGTAVAMLLGARLAILASTLVGIFGGRRYVEMLSRENSETARRLRS